MAPFVLSFPVSMFVFLFGMEEYMETTLVLSRGCDCFLLEIRCSDPYPLQYVSLLPPSSLWFRLPAPSPSSALLSLVCRSGRITGDGQVQKGIDVSQSLLKHHSDSLVSMRTWGCYFICVDMSQLCSSAKMAGFSFSIHHKLY